MELNLCPVGDDVGFFTLEQVCVVIINQYQHMRRVKVGHREREQGHLVPGKWPSV